MTQKTIFLTLGAEILKRCSSQNVTVHSDLSIYLMELKLLQLSKDLSIVTHNENLAETLIKECVNDFIENSVAIKTLKLQLLWQKKYSTIDELKKVHHERVLENIIPIMSELVEDRPVKAVDKDVFIKKIVIFIIMFAGLGSPTQQSIIKETQAAFLSIFKTTELENFLSLPKPMKEQQLTEFSRLITGILLFNKDCKKGGEEMDDLPLILTEGVRATKERLLGFKDELDQKIDHLVKTLLRNYINLDFKENNVENEPYNKISQLSRSQKEKLEEIKTSLIYFRHIECCLNDLIKDLEITFASVEELVQRLQTTLLQIHNVVRYRVAVTTIQVFPLFLTLSDIWVEMQEEVDILSEINDIFMDLSLAGNLSLPASLEVLSSGEDDPLESDSDRISDSFDFYPGIQVCSISSLPSHESLQYKGFCAYTLAKTEGLLITGNITLGVILYSNRFYTFASTKAASKWALNPNHYIDTVLQIAKVKYELIKFLNLESDLIEKLSVKDQKVKTATVQSQTDLHPLESLISRDYTFSEWELRRRLIKIVTLNRYVTKSQQTTNQSCFRKEMAVQVSLCKNVSTQTVNDGFRNHPIVSRYVWGLKTK